MERRPPMNLKTLFAVSTLVAALPAFAHDIAKGPHGGRVVEAGDYHVELVAKGTLVEVFLTEARDKSVAPAGFKVVAILMIGGKSARVALGPTGNKKISGSA